MPQKAQRIGDNIKRARRALGMTQAELARRLGVHAVTVARYESGVIELREGMLREVAAALETTPAALVSPDAARSAEPDAGGGEPVRFAPSLAVSRRLPPQVYAAVHGHLTRMERAGCTEEQIDEAERLMIDGAFNKLHAGDPRERSEAELLMDVEAAWQFIRDVLRRGGAKL